MSIVLSDLENQDVIFINSTDKMPWDGRVVGINLQTNQAYIEYKWGGKPKKKKVGFESIIYLFVADLDLPLTQIYLFSAHLKEVNAIPDITWSKLEKWTNERVDNQSLADRAVVIQKA